MKRGSRHSLEDLFFLIDLRMTHARESSRERFGEMVDEVVIGQAGVA